MTAKERITGFEISRKLEEEKASTWARLVPEKRQLMGALIGFVALFGAFLVSCWLATNPFESTMRAADSIYNQTHGLVGTNQWTLIWSIVALGLFFEFMDASAGMGFGTVMSPVLMIMGFTPLQVVPAIMIQQGICGLVGTLLHREFENVEWKFSPMSETIKLWLLISILGCAATLFSITAVYGIFKFAKVWIKLYVTVLMAGMAIVAVYQAMTRGAAKRPYHFKRMGFYAFLAGFNKGIGGGGYGPVITIGGILSGVPVKAQMAVTAISEGTVSTFACIVWFVMLANGTHIDFIILPSMMLAAVGGGILAPYATRVFPEKFWTWVVPIYCILTVIFISYKIGPEVLKAISKLGM